MSAAEFVKRVNRDIQAKLGFEPIEWVPGADPEPVPGVAVADPHRPREWKNWATKRQAIFGMYLIGQAERWYNAQIAVDPRYMWNWNVSTTAFITRFDNDSKKGMTEIELEKLKRLPSQTIEDWNTQIVDLVDIAFAHENAVTRLEKVRSYFKKGLSRKLASEYNKLYLTNRAEDHNVIVNQVHVLDLAEKFTDGTIGQQIKTLENDIAECTITEKNINME